MNASRKYLIFNSFIFLSFFATLFLTLTNGIPLIEWNLMGVLKSKTRYVNMMRIPVALFFTFLIGTYFIHRRLFEELWIVKTFNYLAEKRFWSFVFSLFVAYSFVGILVSITRHVALETRAFDLGIFAGAIWNTLQGDWFYSSLKDGINLMGDHMSPSLLLTVPFYALWEDPRTLLIIQVIATACAIFLVAKIAWERLEDRRAAIFFALCYFVYYPARAALHDDFHPEVIIEPFIYLAFIFLDKGRIKLFFLMLILIASGKENMAGVVFALGFYAFCFKQKYFTGILTMIFAVGFFYATVHYLIPALSGSPYFYQGNYTELLKEPSGLFQMLSEGERWEYLSKVYMAFGFLPFAHVPTLLLTGPILLQNFISHNETMRSFSYHYLTGMIPFLFISSIYGLHHLAKKITWVKSNQVLICAILFFIALMRSGPSEYFYYWQSSSNRTSHTEMIRAQLKSIPPEASVLTHNNLAPQLINRKEMHQFDYTTLNTKLEYALSKSVDYVIMETGLWEKDTEPPAIVLPKLKANGYTTYFESDGFYILKKR